MRLAVLSIGTTAVLIGAAAAAGDATGAGSASRSAGTALTVDAIKVHPGQSIQRAVNRADPGDTILIEPGHYQQSVLVNKNHLEIRGSGDSLGGTVLEPAATPHGFCAAQARSGICVLDPHGQRTIVGTTVSNLLVRDFEGDGVVGVGTRNFLVHDVVAHRNARYGITRFDSTGGGMFNNVATGSGDAGIYVGDSPDANVTILGNEVWNNGFGILMRNSQGGSIQLNDVHDNCIGIFIWWLPGVAGDSVISYNTVRRNNKFCASSEEVTFDYSGSGIALMGAQNTLVVQNSVLNNRGDTPVSGGIVLVSGERDGGPPSTDNVIKHNTAFGDAPADLIDHSRGSGNEFIANKCFISKPSGMCKY